MRRYQSVQILTYVTEDLITGDLMSTKNKLEGSTLTPWRESVLTMVKEKNKKLKQKTQSRQTRPDNIT